MTRRLSALWEQLAAMAADSDEAATMRRCYVTAATGASVVLSSPDRTAIRMTDRATSSAYTVAPPDPHGGWRIQHATVGDRVLAPVPYAFAGAPSLVDAGLADPIRRLPTEDGAMFSAERDRTLIDADLTQRTVRLYTSRPSSAALLLPQLVRQAMTTQLRAGGAVHAHASAAIIDGVGVMIAGPHGSGKTSTLLAALRLLGADLVADGRILLLRDRDGLLGLPWPTPLAIGSGTLSAHPELRGLLGAPDPRMQATGHTVTIDPSQADLLLARGRLQDRFRPRLLLLPELAFDRGPEVPTAAAVDRETLRRRLIHTRLFIVDRGRLPNARIEEWISDPAPPTEPRPITPALRGVVDDLAQLDCHPVHVTRDPTGIARQITALLPTGPIRTVA